MSQDYSSDDGFTLLEFTSLGGVVPDFVRDAGVPSSEELSKLGSDSFADKRSRKYPLHNKGVAWVSALYALSHGADPEVIEGVKRAGAAYRFENEIYQMEQILARKLASSPKKAKEANEADEVVDNGFGLDLSGGRYTRGPGVAGIKAATDDLLDQRFVDLMPSADIRGIARATITQARKLALDLPERVSILAGYAIPDLGELQAAITARAIGVQSKDAAEFRSLADGIKTASDISPDDADRMVDFLDRMDKQNEVVHLRGVKFPDPFASVYGLTIERASKLAEDFESVEFPCGVSVGHVSAREEGFMSLVRSVLPEYDGTLEGIKRASDEELADIDELLASSLAANLNPPIMAAPTVDPEKRQARKKLLEDPGTFATVLHAIAMEAYGNDFIEWEEETIVLELQDDYGVVLPEGQATKLWALSAALVGGAFFTEPEVFEMTCEALSGSIPEEGSFPSEDVLPGELAWGVVEVMINNPDRRVFDVDVAAYAGVQLVHNGILTAFQPLGFAIIPEQYAPASIEINESSTNAAVAVRFVSEQMHELYRQLLSVEEFHPVAKSLEKMLMEESFVTTSASHSVE